MIIVRSGLPDVMVDTIVAPPQHYEPGGVTVPSSSAGDIEGLNGAEVRGGRPDAQSSGAMNIRSGNPGQVSLVRIGDGLLGDGHSIASVSLQFR